MRLLCVAVGPPRAPGPRYALELARALRSVPGAEVVLSLAEGAELMADGLPECDLPMPTYRGPAGWAARLATLPFTAPALARRLRALRLDGALCAMPAPLDLLMAAGLAAGGGAVWYVTVHDVALHPGDILPMQMVLQRRLLRRAATLVALSRHVAGQLQARGEGAGRPLLTARLSPLRYGTAPPAARVAGRAASVAQFRAAAALQGLGPAGRGHGHGARLRTDRVEGRRHRPESPALETLRRLPGGDGWRTAGCPKAKWGRCWAGRMRWCCPIRRRARAGWPPRP